MFTGHFNFFPEQMQSAGIPYSLEQAIAQHTGVVEGDVQYVLHRMRYIASEATYITRMDRGNADHIAAEAYLATAYFPDITQLPVLLRLWMQWCNACYEVARYGAHGNTAQRVA